MTTQTATKPTCRGCGNTAVVVSRVARDDAKGRTRFTCAICPRRVWFKYDEKPQEPRRPAPLPDPRVFYWTGLD